MIRAFGLIIFAKLFSKPVDLYSRDGIFTGIETRRSIQHIDGDIVFLDLIGFARKIFLAQVP